MFCVLFKKFIRRDIERHFIPKEWSMAIQGDLHFRAVLHLRRLAFILCWDADDAEIFLHATLFQAWAEGEVPVFEDVTAWVATIVMNAVRSGHAQEGTQATPPDSPQTGNGFRLSSKKSRLQAALLQLPLEECEALVMATIGGSSLEKTAPFCNYNTNGAAARVYRARNRLHDILVAQREKEMILLNIAYLNRKKLF
jgi:DNA-directed RNA polymerase specialized sigma24 family protein